MDSFARSDDSNVHSLFYVSSDKGLILFATTDQSKATVTLKYDGDAVTYLL